MTYHAALVSFVETRLFTRLVQEYLSDDEYSGLQQALLADPELGAVIPGTGGSARCAGAFPGVASAEAFESSIFSAPSRARFGCLPSTRRTWPKTFRHTF